MLVTKVLMIVGELFPGAEILIAHHYQLIIAHNGTEALNLARSQPPDLILMDAELENLDAYEMAADFAHLTETRDVPIVALVTEGSEDDQLALTYCRGLATKPVDPQVLLEVVTRYARRTAVLRPSPEPEARTDPLQRNEAGQDLRREIEQLKDELAAIYQEAKQAGQNAALLAQVNAVVHELSQPMTLIMGYAQMLPGHLDSAGTVRFDCAMIVEQVQRMATSLNQLRHLAQGKQMTLELKALPRDFTSSLDPQSCGPWHGPHD